MQVSGWFEGVRLEELVAGARSCVEGGHGFVLEAWGLRDAGSGDRDLSDRLELGERVIHDGRRENGDDGRDREDWVVVKAMAAAPGRSFMELLQRAAG